MSGIGNVRPGAAATTGTGGAAPAAPAAPGTATGTPAAPAAPTTPAPRPSAGTAATETARRTADAALVASRIPGAAARARTVNVGGVAGTDRRVSFSPSTGKFSVIDAGGRRRGSAADGLYAAAQLVSSGGSDFLARLDGPAKAKLVETLEASLKQGNEATGKPTVSDLKSRSGAATLGLALARSLPAGDPLRGRLVSASIDQMKVEKERGLRGSMAINVDAAKRELGLSPAQQKDLAGALEAALPTKPPYEEWFKNGRTDLKMRYFGHPEFFESDTADFERLGFQKEVKPDRVVFTKTYTDPSGRNPPMPVTVEAFKTEKDLFRGMDDPGTQIEFYSGHSNLGGNVLGALADGPELQHGAKWVVNWMCRGKQVVADVYNRFPDAHYMTTSDPVHAHGKELLDAMFTGIARREGYGAMRDKLARDGMWERGALMFPDDRRNLEVRDEDKDGMTTTGAGRIDPLYNVGLARTGETGRNLRPEPVTTNPRDLAGDKIMRGVSFLNTLLTYHHDHATDGRLPAGAADRIVADGWFDGQGTDDVVRVSERKVGGETYYDVKVNAKYANQDADTLGAAMAYEVNRHLSIKNNGSYNDQDKLRGAIFAGEYVSYIVDTLDEAQDTMRAIDSKYGFGGKLTWSRVERAIDSDGHGYGTPAQMRELERAVGRPDPRVG